MILSNRLQLSFAFFFLKEKETQTIVTFNPQLQKGETRNKMNSPRLGSVTTTAREEMRLWESDLIFCCVVPIDVRSSTQRTALTGVPFPAHPLRFSSLITSYFNCSNKTIQLRKHVTECVKN